MISLFSDGRLGDYVIATAADMPKEDSYEIIEVPHPDGPYGTKGFCEMSSNAQIPAITAAIHDAIGVWITEFPTTPEMILRALESRRLLNKISVILFQILSIYFHGIDSK